MVGHSMVAIVQTTVPCYHTNTIQIRMQILLMNRYTEYWSTLSKKIKIHTDTQNTAEIIE